MLGGGRHVSGHRRGTLRETGALTDDIFLSPAGGRSYAPLGHPISVRWTLRGQAHEDLRMQVARGRSKGHVDA